MNNQVTSQPLVIWALVVVSIALVAGITYVYTNRNIRLTSIFTVISIFAIALIKLIGEVDIEVNQHFIGGFDQAHVPYIAADPGWHQIFYAWHIWALPVTFVIIISSILLYLVWHFHGEVKKVDVLPTSTSGTKTVYQQTTRAERLSNFMAMDAAKKESQQVNEKLAEALLMNAAYEIKISDINMHTHDLESELSSLKRATKEEITTLQLELSAKHKENDYIAQQLSERSRELLRAQEMFEKLLGIQDSENT